MTAIPDDVKLPGPGGAPAFAWMPEVEEKILDLIMEGQAVRQILNETRPEGWPSQVTFFKRVRDDEEFAKRYARAKEIMADAEFDEILDIADNASNDWMEKNDPDNPGWLLNHDHVARSRLRVDARRWRLGKLAPKKYGDKIDLSVPADGLRVFIDTGAPPRA